MTLTIRFGGYQGPQSVHTRAADVFRTAVTEAAGLDINVDLLATYLVNPWTALYVGYNNNQNDRRLVPAGNGFALVPRDRIGPDSWQFFVKFSYLFRF